MKYRMTWAALLWAALVTPSFAEEYFCPDPNSTSLKWGEVPPPWEENPFSSNPPRGEDNTRFVRANILVAGTGRGVMCTYSNSMGEYSIWWQVRVKIPARDDYRWVETQGGYVCSDGLLDCPFYVAQ